ncbi:MAG: hypothetical protein COA81_00005 [Alphaproteobacteria bacterium]|nr:MAG: hypothetical protein COA81_00005 [Alphaproteobacteria bacterium]
MEIVAYRLGHICGIPVPPAFVSIDSDGICRALIEWFYDEEKDNYINGFTLLSHRDRALDKKYGRRHCYPLLKDGLNIIQRLSPKDGPLLQKAFRLFVFDALIANTDRHHENWGIILKGARSKGQELILDLSPAFDNGTSLGYNFIDNKLSNYIGNKTWLDKYVEKGTHHLRKEAEGDKYKHVELIVEMTETNLEYKDLLSQILSFNMDDVKEMLHELIKFDISVPFIEKRADFTAMIIGAKKKALSRILD